MEVKKIYVNSGTMRWVGMAQGPIAAIIRALDAHTQKCPVSNCRPLDATTVFLDERGFRTDTAQYKVPVEQALTEAGYIFEDEGSVPDDFSPSVEE
jgi:hypothetical protein